jgi:hypothetical protein
MLGYNYPNVKYKRVSHDGKKVKAKLPPWEYKVVDLEHVKETRYFVSVEDAMAYCDTLDRGVVYRKGWPKAGVYGYWCKPVPKW